MGIWRESLRAEIQKRSQELDLKDPLYLDKESGLNPEIQEEGTEE
jgi:hypothetical protein